MFFHKRKTQTATDLFIAELCHNIEYKYGPWKYLPNSYRFEHETLGLVVSFYHGNVFYKSLTTINALLQDITSEQAQLLKDACFKRLADMLAEERDIQMKNELSQKLQIIYNDRFGG